ncbi:MAG: tRNA lysidine(34) synthetase TilS [Chloroflexota bacterium]
MTADLPVLVAEFCQKHRLLARQDKVVVGVSGGPDSLCLLHLLDTLKAELQLSLIVAHLNHQLREADAQADEDFVRETAAAWQLPIRVETQNVAALAAARKQSVEETARQVRYAFLGRVAAEAGAAKIAVGHTADDQVETVLMHFLRGSGLAGLRGMRPMTNMAGLRLHPHDRPAFEAEPSPRLIRPLLEVARADIEAYCRRYGLTPRQDYSNQDTTFFRNRLRHELIPTLATYNPNIRQVIQNMAQVITAEVELLTDQLDQIWPMVVRKASPARIELDRQLWLNLPLAQKRSTLRQAVHQLRRSLRDVNFEHIENAIAVIEKADTGAKATLPQGLMLTVDYHRLIIADKQASAGPPPEFPHLSEAQVVPVNVPGLTPLPPTPWQLRADLLLPDELEPQRLEQAGPWEAYLDAAMVASAPVLRARRPGDTFCPFGLKGHRQKVNEFMINKKIPLNWRNLIPLLVANDQILWICGYHPDERACLRRTTQQVIHLKFEQK